MFGFVLAVLALLQGSKDVESQLLPSELLRFVDHQSCSDLLPHQLMHMLQCSIGVWSEIAKVEAGRRG